jgi:AcrR family transcriptional regulator
MQEGIALPQAQPAALPPQPSRPRVAQRRARVRESLLGVGARLFVAEGVENVSVEDVIAAADIARSTFYTFFTSKRDLLVHIVEPVFTTGSTSFAALMGLPPRAMMAGVIDTYLTLWERHGDALLLSTRIARADLHLFERVHRSYVDALTKVLTAVHPSGILRNGSVEHTRKLIAKSAVDILLVYRNDPDLRRLYRSTMEGMLLAG